jgi:Protein of unknown function (DUF3396)
MDKSVRLDDAQGQCLVRDNLVIVFFGARPFAEMVEGVAKCVDRYLALIPSDALRWSIIGATSDTYKALTPKDLAQCRALLTPGTAKQKDIHFRLLGPESAGPDYRLVVNGYKRPEKRDATQQANSIEMRFPREFLALRGADDVASTVRQMFDDLPCDSGYASVALCFGMDARRSEASSLIAPTAFRSHGYDVPNTLHTTTQLGERSRGARWITMLGTHLVDRLGGKGALAAKLAAGIDVAEGRHGLVLRAGSEPEIGDVNRQRSTPLLASVAHAIEPVSYFGDKALIALLGGPDARTRWERRFWPDA